MKKHILYAFIITAIILQGCKKKGDETPPPVNVVPSPVLKINTPSADKGYLYVDGKYMGRMAPADIPLKKGKHVIGVAFDNGFKYLRKEIEITENTTLTLTANDAPAPKTWKALWVGISQATDGKCNTRFSKEELNAGFDYFKWSIEEHFEKYAYGTIKWNIERKDIQAAVNLQKGGRGFTLEPSELNKHMQVKPGDYDCIFVFWREKDGTCQLTGNYFGLGWLDDKEKTGYVVVKFDVGDGTIQQKIDSYKNNDPGIWVHEWLHTVGERYFIKRGSILPNQAGDGFRVHAAGQYGYIEPWMSWYKDFISGRIMDNFNGYVGIGPEILLNCPLRDVEVGNCK